ncbi:MAG: glycosyltransferase family 2 protein [Chloroflexota bacterium]|nr:MAG: glycosyltransferase family 2 protein [Chloroflexota bacterium]
MGIHFIIIEFLYLLNIGLLAIYGINALILAGLRRWRHSSIPIIDPDENYDWPQVTVQLPVYNERYVVERLIESVAALDYPRDRLHIQVLDDSSDITSEIVSRSVSAFQSRGTDIAHVQRSKRRGYKGGALAYGMRFAKGDFIAIFDADFMPTPGFLKRTIPYFERDIEIGCLQTRWGHLNRENSWLTRTQANGIDGHFIIEQETKSEAGLFLNFNGTAGVWRRQCIEDAGGWQHDTLTEDLDLSYRAQLRGWKIRYLPHIITPAELPEKISAFKSQQFRWAKGSIQTARKMLGELWRSSQPLVVKVEGTIHLTHYAVHPLMIINLLLIVPLLLGRNFLLNIYPFFALAAIGPLFMYLTAMGKQKVPMLRRLFNLLMLVLLGMGLSLNNTRAVAEALIGKKTPFKRTPKYNLRNDQYGGKNLDYLLPRSGMVWLEALVGLYAVALLLVALSQGNWGLVFWLSLISGGYIYTTLIGFRQSIEEKQAQTLSTVGESFKVAPQTTTSHTGQD